ncbi:MAG: chemotaxis protein CheW [Fimbriimonas sp.]
MPEKYVLFALDDRRFGLPLTHVERILAAPPLTRLACAPREVRGIFDLRGDVLPVLDTRALLDLREEEPRVLLVVHSGERRLALTADRVDSIADLGADDIQAVTAEMGRPLRVGKVGDVLALLLDVDDIVSEQLGASATQLAALAA